MEQYLDIRAITENEKVKIECIREVLFQLLWTPYQKNRPEMSTYKRNVFGIYEKYTGLD